MDFEEYYSNHMFVNGSFICNSSMVDDDVKLGYNVGIWRWCHIADGVKIGNNVNIGDHCYIGPNVIIGNDVRIQNNVFIPEGVTIGNNVFIGPGTVFTNDREPQPPLSVRPKEEWLKPINVGNNVVIGANCTILAGIDIDDNSYIGAMSFVNKNIPEYARAYGNPIQIIPLYQQRVKLD